MTKHRFRYMIPALILVLPWSGACSHRIPETSTKPAPPPITSAIPSFAALNKEQPKAPISPVPLQIKTDLTSVQTALQNAIPERFTEAGQALEGLPVDVCSKRTTPSQDSGRPRGDTCRL